MQEFDTMKTILVLVGGADSDELVFETAHAAALPFAAHLNFLHIHVGAGQAAVHSPHTEFAAGPSLSNALQELDAQAKDRSKKAAEHVRTFCARSDIAICDTPAPSDRVTASWHEERNDALERVIFHARHKELVVLARAKRPNGLPADFLQRLLLDCGRPVLIAGPTPPRTLPGTVMVCWRESADAARAVAAAMPLLQKAKRAIFASVAPSDSEIVDVMADITRQLAWSGIPVEDKLISPHGGTPQELIAAAAQTTGADLVVMGAYGHSRLRELLFGGFTQSFIDRADRPVLLMH
jgi:nucleotide-binding universal stress UspA family protein